MRVVKTEVPDFEAYEGCARLEDIERFLTVRGFKDLARHRFASRSAGASYFDVVYGR